MAVKVGSTTPSKFYVGSNTVSKLFQGSNAVYSSASLVSYVSHAVFGEFLTNPPHSIPIPAADVGDLRMMFAVGNNQSSTVNNPPTVSGWDSIPGNSGAGDFQADGFAWKRVKQSGDTDSNVAVSLADGGASNQWLGNVVSIRFNGGPITPANFVSTYHTRTPGTFNNAIAPTLTTIDPSYIYAFCGAGSNSVVTAPAGWTQQFVITAPPATGWTSKLFKLDAHQAAGAIVPATTFTWGSSVSYPMVWMFALASPAS